MATAIIFIFIAGYILVALESAIHISKTAISLLMAVLCWTILYTCSGGSTEHASAFTKALGENSEVVDGHFDKKSCNSLSKCVGFKGICLIFGGLWRKNSIFFAIVCRRVFLLQSSDMVAAPHPTRITVVYLHIFGDEGVIIGQQARARTAFGRAVRSAWSVVAGERIFRRRWPSACIRTSPSSDEFVLCWYDRCYICD